MPKRYIDTTSPWENYYVNLMPKIPPLLLLRVGLDCAFGVCVFPFFFSFFFLHAFVRLRLLFMYCSMNSSHKVWLFYFFQPISAYRALFMDPQISLFSNFFIKNGSHGTIHTLKNYFACFQFSIFSFRKINFI